ncbi:MAG: hypothetical protein KDC43_07295 [Saprospiraceae bacterium]|nr:hypothetical protein [Saprospiraceae bacterium]MCB0623711.1 hypothetical protein [Saprospiraceae bacterium]MCB0675259.1 hypothetical protein [Saprospiraceae bacterium]MCB0679628.1 hypothetical protein [Saprospiraceae bacterium]
MKVRKTWKSLVRRPAVRKRAAAIKRARRPVRPLTITAGPPEESEFDSNPWLGIRWKGE